MDLLNSFDPSKRILPESKPAPHPWPRIGQETMTIEGLRVTLCTIKHEPDQVTFATSVHIMYAHDDVRSVSLKFPYFTEREAIKFATDAIKTHREKEEAARRAAQKPVPGTIGVAVHRLLEEANSAYDTYGDEFDLDDLQEAIGWVESFLVDSVIVRADRPEQGEPDGG